MKPDLVKDIFGFNLVAMRYLGFYPPLKHKGLYKIFTYCVYAFCTTAVPVLASLHLLIRENVDIQQVSDSSFLIIQIGCFIFKMLPFIRNGDEIRKIIYMIEDPVFIKNAETEGKIIDKCKKICKRITWLFFGFCLLSWFLWASTPFFNRKSTKMPLEIWLPFDTQMQLSTSPWSYFFVVLGVFNGATSNGAVDPLVAGLACYAAFQLKVLQNNLKHLSEYAKQEIGKIDKNGSSEKECLEKVILRRIKECVKYHDTIFKFVQKYEKLYSSVVFVQFTASILVICLSCWQLSMIEPFTFRFFFMIAFLLTMLLEIFLYCYFGTSLYLESNNLTTAIYMSNWYEFDQSSKQALIVLMERSKRPMIVTAGKVLDLSLVTFTTILRRAYSLFAVLKNY